MFNIISEMKKILRSFSSSVRTNRFYRLAICILLLSLFCSDYQNLQLPYDVNNDENRYSNTFLINAFGDDTGKSVKKSDFTENPEVKKKLESIYTWLKMNTGGGRAPTAVLALLHKDKIIIKKAFHTTPDRLYSAASHTKFFTTFAILQLHDRGLLNIDDPISKYLPYKIERGGSAPVTIRHALSHTSGMMEGHYQGFRAGRGIYYSNSGFNLISKLVPALTGKSLGEYVRENILTPLEMPNADSSKMHGAGLFMWSLNDMVLFMKLFLARGIHKGRRIIADRWFDEIYKPVRIGIPLARNKTYRGICYRVLSIDDRPFSINHAALWPGSGGYFHLFPRHEIGFIIMTSSPTANLDEDHRIDPYFASYYCALRRQLYELIALMSDADLDPAKYHATGTSKEILDRYPGTYINPMTKTTIDINIQNYNIIANAPGIGKTVLLSSGPNKFYPLRNNDEFFFVLIRNQAHSIVFKNNLYIRSELVN